MSAEDNKAVVRQLHYALDRGDLSVLDQHPGLAEIKPTLERSRADLAGAQMTIAELLAEGGTSVLSSRGAKGGTMLPCAMLALLPPLAAIVVPRADTAPGAATGRRDRGLVAALPGGARGHNCIARTVLQLLPEVRAGGAPRSMQRDASLRPHPDGR